MFGSSVSRTNLPTYLGRIAFGCVSAFAQRSRRLLPCLMRCSWRPAWPYPAPHLLGYMASVSFLSAPLRRDSPEAAGNGAFASRAFAVVVFSPGPGAELLYRRVHESEGRP